jgi:hypothetical protein
MPGAAEVEFEPASPGGQSTRISGLDLMYLLDTNVVSELRKTALVHGLTVATRNVADFVSTGVGVLNPWES